MSLRFLTVSTLPGLKNWTWAGTCLAILGKELQAFKISFVPGALGTSESMLLGNR